MFTSEVRQQCWTLQRGSLKSFPKPLAGLEKSKWMSEHLGTHRERIPIHIIINFAL